MEILTSRYGNRDYRQIASGTIAIKTIFLLTLLRNFAIASPITSACSITEATSFEVKTGHSNSTGHATIRAIWQVPSEVLESQDISEISAHVSLCLFPLGEVPKPTARPTLQPTNSPTRLPTSRSPTQSPSIAVILPPTEPPKLTCPNSQANTINCFEDRTNFSPLECYAVGCCYDPLNTEGPVCYPRTEYYTFSPTSSAPSLSPSAAPSQQPSSSPSSAPSLNPTATPSRSPTASPSARPSPSPSNAPSSSPTSSPSNAPSSSPTSSPSNAPSSNPTSSPSNAPSSNPTSSPVAARRRLSAVEEAEESEASLADETLTPRRILTVEEMEPTEVPLMDGIIGYCLPQTTLSFSDPTQISSPIEQLLNTAHFLGMGAGNYTARGELRWEHDGHICAEPASSLLNITLCTTEALPATVGLGEACPEAVLTYEEHCHDNTRMSSACKLCTVDSSNCPSNFTKAMLESDTGDTDICLRDNDECNSQWDRLTTGADHTELESLTSYGQCELVEEPLIPFFVPKSDCISPCRPGYQYVASRSRCEPLTGSVRCTDGFVFDFKRTCEVQQVDVPNADAGSSIETVGLLDGLVIPPIEIGSGNVSATETIASLWWVTSSWTIENFTFSAAPSSGEDEMFLWMFPQDSSHVPVIQSADQLTTIVKLFWPGIYFFRLTIFDQYTQAETSDIMSITVHGVSPAHSPSEPLVALQQAEGTAKYTLTPSSNLINHLHLMDSTQLGETNTWIEVHLLPTSSQVASVLSLSSSLHRVRWDALRDNPLGMNVTAANAEVSQLNGSLLPVAVVVQDWQVPGLELVWRAVVALATSPSGEVVLQTDTPELRYESGPWSECVDNQRWRAVRCVRTGGEAVSMNRCVAVLGVARAPLQRTACQGTVVVPLLSNSMASWILRDKATTTDVCTVEEKPTEGLELRDPCMDRWQCRDSTSLIPLPSGRCNQTELASICGGLQGLSCPFAKGPGLRTAWFVGEWGVDDSLACNGGDQQVMSREVHCLNIFQGLQSATQANEQDCPRPKPSNTKSIGCGRSPQGSTSLQWLTPLAEFANASCPEGWCMGAHQSDFASPLCVDMTTGAEEPDEHCDENFGSPDQWLGYTSDQCESEVQSQDVCPPLGSANASWVTAPSDEVVACPSRVVSLDSSACCTSSASVLDRHGRCCESGVLDGCGECDAGLDNILIAVPSLQNPFMCCDAVDAGGNCCQRPLAVDECGVCGGDGLSCAVVINVAGTSEARRLEGNRRKHQEQPGSRSRLLESGDTTTLGAAIASINQFSTGSRQAAVIGLLSQVPPTIREGIRGAWVTESKLAIWEERESELGWTSHTNLNEVFHLFDIHAERQGICGNGICEVGELCIDGSTAGCCEPDCPLWSRTCAVGANGLECGGHGSCQRSTGQCLCWRNQGYTGSSCETCLSGWVMLDREDGSVICVPGKMQPVFLSVSEDSGGNLPPTNVPDEARTFGEQWWPLLVSLACLVLAIILSISMLKNICWQVYRYFSSCFKRTISRKVLASTHELDETDDNTDEFSTDEQGLIPKVHFESSGVVLPELMQDETENNRDVKAKSRKSEEGARKPSPAGVSESDAVGQQGWVKIRPQRSLGKTKQGHDSQVLWETYYFVLFPHEKQLVYYTNVSNTRKGKVFLGETGSISLDKLCFVKSLQKRQNKGKTFQIGIYLEVHEQRFDAHGHTFETFESVQVITHDFVARTREERQQWVDALSFHVNTSGILQTQ